MKKLFSTGLILISIINSCSFAQTTRLVPSQYSTIQSAIDAAVDGDTILISSGIFHENVAFSGRILTLIGSTGTEIDGGSGIGIRQVLGSMQIQNITFKNSSFAYHMEGYWDLAPSVTFKHCRFDSNSKAIYGVDYTNITVVNCVFTNNEMAYQQEYYFGSGLISNSTFSNNQTDIYFNPIYPPTNHTVVVQNCILSSAVASGIDNYITLSYCRFDSTKIGSGVRVLYGNISSDPIFTDIANQDFTLQSGSPCRDSGDPNSLFNDSDGTRNDMGYTGGGWAAAIPSPLDYSYIKINTSKTINVKIRNLEFQNLEITNILFDNTQLSTTTASPISILRGQQVIIPITFLAQSIGEFSSSVRFQMTGLPSSTEAIFPVHASVYDYSNRTILIPSTFPTIQDGIDFSVDGDTIRVSPGIYKENLRLGGKELYLMSSKGPDSTIIDGGGSIGVRVTEDAQKTVFGFSVVNSSHGFSVIGTITISNCKIRENHFGVYSNLGYGVRINNSLFVKNYTGIEQVTIVWPSSTHITNCTFVSNNPGGDISRGDIRDASSPFEITNCILTGSLWNSPPTGILPITVTHSRVDTTLAGGPITFGEGITDALPQFVDTLSGNYRLQESSPLINSGRSDTTGLLVPLIDLDGNQRIYGRIDIGAYENQTNALPVELSSFSSVINNKCVRLYWKTATELDNYGFEVERRKVFVTTQWTKIGFVGGNGTSSSPKEYTYSDVKLSAGRYAYRLKQIDNDGTFKYSSESEIVFEAPTSYALNQNYPNPFNPSTDISFDVPMRGTVMLKVYNVIGQEVITLVNEMKEAGSYSVKFNASSLPSGLYFAKFTSGDWMKVVKMMLMK